MWNEANRNEKRSIGTSIRKWAAGMAGGLLFMLFFITILTSGGQDNLFSSKKLHAWSSEIQQNLLLPAFVFENHYFESAVPDEEESRPVPTLMFEFLTRLDFHEPRTMLGMEIPGFALFDGNIVVAGEGTDFTTMPIESAPPMEVLMKEREAADDRLQVLDTQEETENNDASGPAVAHIVHSHSRESYYPELEEGADSAFHQDVNITMVGKRLGKELEERGVQTFVDTTDITQRLHQKGWTFPRSYDVSRTVIQNDRKEHPELEMFFDLHRDSQPRDITTVTINQETMAKTFFVIGENHPDYEKNLAMAKDLNRRLEASYPGLSRGVLTKGGGGVNGRYNQDLSKQSVLIEIGGVENTLEETYRTTEALAEVISSYHKDTNK
ncbi:stage II sporulation protein P [Salibacterium halotolerans]|uniref:Stage II sporulation protein P n=1 Tax=Salibacterium halotolerans TaxID=1884432 RepID=A0A1I5NG32_9BACI|nr:stage II sporulation protein P [Salibacterium halotolerans]SFP20306.1 stage II sporulation protein P [Salibacterium halotolerans]